MKSYICASYGGIALLLISGRSQQVLARRLAKYGIHDMRGIVNFPEEILYKEFGVNAELLIDHAWGRESCTIADIKQYKSKSKSVSFSQILPRDYSFAEARIVMTEMAQNGSMELLKRHLITSRGFLFYRAIQKNNAPQTAGSLKLNWQLPDVLFWNPR